MLGAMFGLGFILGPVMGGLLGGDRPAAAVLRRRLPRAGQPALWLVRRCPNRCRRSAARPFALAPCANPVAALRGLAPTRRRRHAGRGDRLRRRSRSSCSTPPGCSTRPSSSAGGRRRTAGRSLTSAACRRSCRACCSAGCCSASAPQRLAVAGPGLVHPRLSRLGRGHRGLDDVRDHPLQPVLGFTVAASIQSIISSAADPRRRRAGRWARWARCNSLMAVVAPVVGAPLLALVSHLPQGDWRIGAPFYFCALVAARRAGPCLAALPPRAGATAAASPRPT